MINNSLDFIMIYSNNNPIKACFSCCQKDYEKYNERILNDIIPINNNIDIYYNNTKEINDDDKSTYYEYLKEFNLFIFPISYSFLSNKSIARDIDFVFALKNNYPILPIIVEPGLEGILGKKFNSFHILDKLININNQNEYRQILKYFFEKVLPSKNNDIEIEKILSSYVYIINNDNDLHYVNKISKIIHKDNKNIGIYHCNSSIEYENNIEKEKEKIMKSSAVILIVSSNVVNYSNTALYEKYQIAEQLSKPILPIIVDGCNTKTLENKLTSLPKIIEINNTDSLLGQINTYCKNQPLSDNIIGLYNNGLAYLFSIGVNKDFEYGVKQLEEAASKKHIPSIQFLSDMYSYGLFTDIDYKKSIYYKNLELKYSNNENDEQLLIALGDLYYKDKEYYLSRKYYQKCYELVKNRYGVSDLHTISIYHSLGKAYLKTNKLKKALSVFYKCSEQRKILLSEEHPDTLESLLYLAITYNRLDQHDKSKETDEIIFSIMSRIYGKHNIKTLKSMDSLADDYFNLKNYKKSYEISNESYTLKKEIYGENDLETISSLRNIAKIHYSTGDYYKSIELNEQIYNILINLFDIYYPQAVDTLSNISKSYYKLQEYGKSKDISEQVFNIRKDLLGENHPDTLDSMKTLAEIYEKTGNHSGAVKLNEEYKRLHVSAKNNYSIFLAIGAILLIYVIIPIIVISIIINLL